MRSSLGNYSAFCVDAYGGAYNLGVSLDIGVRPAFNLDLSSVLFTSAAVGGKISGAKGAGALNQNLTPSGATEWKLTLKDTGRSGFSITTTNLSSTAATVKYAGAKTGTNEYISATIVDNGSVAYYGRIKSLPNAADASGTVTINIPSGVTLDADTTLRVFNEQFNGDRITGDDTSRAYTDYASELLTVTAPVTPTIAFTTNPASVTTVTQGAITASDTLTAAASVSPSGTATLNWFACDSAGTPSGASLGTGGTFQIPTTLTAGTYYYLCQASYTGAASVNSTVATVTVNTPTSTVAAPTFSPAAGRYTGAQNVTLSCATAGAAIYYTTDSTEPTEQSTPYAGAISITSTTTVKAKAFVPGMTPSAVASATYTIGTTPPGPAPAAPVLPTYTVYNNKNISEADIRLSGAGLDPGDLLIVERMKSGSLYDYMISLAPSGTTLRVYDISLKSGSKGGYPMYLSFDLGVEYEGQIFTLIHRKADGSIESFTAMANPHGTVTFGPLSELSPFSIARGSVDPLSTVAFVAARATACATVRFSRGLLPFRWLRAIVSRSDEKLIFNFARKSKKSRAFLKYCKKSRVYHAIFA